jgi:hypothetical protein
MRKASFEGEKGTRRRRSEWRLERAGSRREEFSMETDWQGMRRVMSEGR